MRRLIRRGPPGRAKPGSVQLPVDSVPSEFAIKVHSIDDLFAESSDVDLGLEAPVVHVNHSASVSLHGLLVVHPNRYDNNHAVEIGSSQDVLVEDCEAYDFFREAFAMAKAYTEARQEHGSSELLDEIVAHRPETDRAKAHSPEELKEHGLQNIRDAVALLAAKATPAELGDYRLFVVSLAKRVAAAKKEKGSEDGVSAAEATAIGEIETALGAV